MVKPNKNSKNKRVSLKKRYKIIRKVKEHHKKKAKDAKKLGFNRKSKVEKGPGIPNDCSLKEQELKALKAKKRKLGLLDEETTIGEAGVTDGFITTAKNNDHSERAFYKELVKVIEASDVILEVLDARDPLGTRSTDMEKMVTKLGADKHLVLLLNKVDLVPREAVEKWLNYLREELPTVTFKCSTQEQKSNLGWKSARKTGESGNRNNYIQTSECLGAVTLIKLLKNYSRSHEIKKSITVGVIGLPNVGKSSIINSLRRAHVVNVGATPGLTRSIQEVQLDKNIKLLDCPGVVMLKSSENDSIVALRNCKRIEKLDDPVGPVKEILKLCPQQVLVTLYKISSFESVDDFLQKVATVRGKLKKGGIVDTGAASRIVLHDWNEGKIPYYTMPPIRNSEEPSEAKIVSELGKKFNVDEVYAGESSYIGSLKSVNNFSPVEVLPNRPLNFDMEMLEDDEQPQFLLKGNSADESMEPSEAKIVSELGKKFNVDEVYAGQSSYIGSLESVNNFNLVEVLPNCPLNFYMEMLEDGEQPQILLKGHNADESMEPSEAKIVSELGKKFNVDEVFAGESSYIGSLKSVNNFNPVEVLPNRTLNFDMEMLEDDEQPQILLKGDSADESMEPNGEVAVSEDKFCNSKQNEKLYAEEGMLNTKLRKASKKRQKRESKQAPMDADTNEDYDFNIDYVRTEYAMDIHDQKDDAPNKSSSNRFELPYGVDIDNE